MNKPTPKLRLAASRLCGATALVLLGAPALLASSGESEAIRVAGVIRDFLPGHPAFRSDRQFDHRDLHIASLMGPMLNENGNPVFTGEGTIVESPATDAFGRAIPPLLAKRGSPLGSFEIVGGRLIPKEQFTARVTLIGAAIQTSSYHVPVTTRIRVGDQVFEPFGAFESPVGGNVNDNQSATGRRNDIESREFVLPGLFPPDTSITVDGSSWLLDSGSGASDNHWGAYMSESSLDNSGQVSVLRDGDPVPNISGAFSQGSVGDYVSEYVDSETQTMRLDANEVIWLFELGTSASNTSADFQDLVVLVSLATGRSAFDGPRDRCGDYLSDVEATMGASDLGGVEAASDVENWFTTNPTENVSAIHAIDLVESDGLYQFSTPDFTPIENGLFGKQGANHNRSFTYEIHADF